MSRLKKLKPSWYNNDYMGMTQYPRADQVFRADFNYSFKPYFYKIDKIYFISKNLS